MKFKIIGPIFCLVFAHSILSYGGGEVGNGGYFCKEKDSAEYVSCDYYFRTREENYNKNQKLVYADIPKEVKTELSLIARLIFNRSFGKIDFLNLTFNASGAHYYNVSDFSGKDDQRFGDDVEARQTGYAYQYNVFDERRPDKRIIRKVIELDIDFLTELGPRKYALALVHEWLHLEEGFDHAIISPFIVSIDTILKIYDRQRNGDRSSLSEEEISQLTTFQALLVQITSIKTSAQKMYNPYSFTLSQGSRYTLDTFNKTRIHPNGGGALLYEDKLSPFPEQHFIGVLGAVKGITVGKIYLSKRKNLEILDELESLSEKTSWVKTAYVDWSAGVETVKDKGGNGNLSGSTALLSRCIEFDESGACQLRQAFIPVDFGLRVGEDIQIRNLSLSIFSLEGENNTASPLHVRCGAKFGNFQHKSLRQAKGRLTNLNAIDGKCRFSFKNSLMGIHLEFGGQMAPLMFYGVGYIKNNDDNRFNGFGYSLGGHSQVGVSFKNLNLNLYADGFGILAEGIFSQRSAYKNKNYGTRLQYKINQSLYLEGKLERVIDEFNLKDKSSGASIASDKNQVDFFGISVGGSHDFLTD